MNKKRIIKKRDLYWCIVCLVLFIIAIFTVKLGDNKNVIDYFGFAGTLIGILLAVVALIYAFYQNYAFQSSTSKLEEAASKIEEVTKQLDKVSEVERIAETVDVIDSNIRHVFENVQEGLQQISDNINLISSNIEDKFTAVGSSYESLNISIHDLWLMKYNKDSSYEDSQINELTLKEDIVAKLADYQFVFISFLSKLNNKNSNILKYTEWALKNSLSPWSDSLTNDNHNQCYNLTLGSLLGTLHIFTIRNWVLLSGPLDESLIDMNEDLINAIKTIESKDNFDTDALKALADLEESGMLD